MSQYALYIAFAGLIASVALAETRELTVNYLRAAMGSVSDRDKLTIVGVYSGENGLKEASTGYLRGKSMSRFTVRDIETGAEFISMYCEHNSRAFDALLKIKDAKVLVFTGYKGRGADKEDAVYVTSVSEARGYDQLSAQKVDDTTRRYRISLTDNTTSNQTVLVNIELGQPYNVLGSTLVIEEEPEPDGRAIQIYGD